MNTIPQAPAPPMDCAAARAFKWLMYEEDLDPEILPRDFSWRIASDEEVLPEQVWEHFGNKPLPENAACTWRFFQLAYLHNLSTSSRMLPGNECFYVDPSFNGPDWRGRIITLFDQLYLHNLALDGSRRQDFHGRISYPEVELEAAKSRDQLLRLYRITSVEKLAEFVQHLGDLQEYNHIPDEIITELSRPEMATVVAHQIAAVNPDLFR